MESFDVIVIGAGMAGASIAYELARAGRRVVLLEAESQPGYHATGRSAALFTEAYGAAPVRALTRAGRSFFESPPDGFSSTLLHPRGCLFVADAGTLPDLEKLADLPDIASRTERLDAGEASALVEILPSQNVAAALFEPASKDIDVHALHQAYLRGFALLGGKLVCDARVEHIERAGRDWLVATRTRHVRAGRVVNAAGAWADAVALEAGAAQVGLQPLRRTVATIDVPRGLASDRWPVVIAADESMYFKPDAGRLLVSPADETPDAAGDAQPDELDVAIAIDRFETLTGCSVPRVVSKWAGLRTFAPDRVPVAGEDPAAPGFFWLAGQGGYGIQIAPALAQCLAALIDGREVPGDLREHGIEAAAIAPGRFAALTRI